MWSNFDDFHIFQHLFLLKNVNLPGPIWIFQFWIILVHQCQIQLSRQFFSTSKFDLWYFCSPLNQNQCLALHLKDLFHIRLEIGTGWRCARGKDRCESQNKYVDTRNFDFTFTGVTFFLTTTKLLKEWRIRNYGSKHSLTEETYGSLTAFVIKTVHIVSKYIAAP